MRSGGRRWRCRGLSRGQAAGRSGRRQVDGQPARRARDHGPQRVPREAPGRVPDDPPGDAPAAGPRAEDRPAHLRRARRQDRRRAQDRRGGGPDPDPARPLRAHRAAHPRGHRQADKRDRRMLLHHAKALVDELVASLAPVLGVGRIVPAGSYRRRRETIGDLDLLAETDEPERVVETFVNLPNVEARDRAGGHKAAVRLGGRGPQVDLMLMRPEQAGTHLIHFTGSKEHNVRLRERARDMGWSLSEYGFAGLGEDGEIITDLRRGRGAADVRHRGGGIRVPRAAVHRAGAARGPRRDRGGARGSPAEPDHRVGPSRRPALPLGLVRRHPHGRGHGRVRAPARPRLPGDDRPHAVAGDRPRPRPRASRAGACADPLAQRAIRDGGGGGHRAARDQPGGLPPPPRLRARDPRRRPARLSGQAPGDLRPRGRVAARLEAAERAPS